MKFGTTHLHHEIWRNITIILLVHIILMKSSFFVQKLKIYTLFSESYNYWYKFFFQFWFQFLKVERKGFMWFNAILHENQMLKSYSVPNASKIFQFWRASFNYNAINKNVDICNFLFLRWQITVGKLILISFLYQKLWIQFYQVLYGKYWELEM